MTSFILAASVVTLVSLWAILRPLLSMAAPQHAGPDRDEVNLAVLRARLAELKTELDTGGLDQSTFEQASADLKTELAQELDDAACASVVQRPTRYAAVALAILLPASATALYWKLGGWQIFTKEIEITRQAELPSVEEMIEKLVAHLRERPDDVRGWAMLGRAQLALERNQAAIVSFERVLVLTDDPDAQFLADYADALARVRDNQLPGHPARMLKKALYKDPRLPKALWLSGFEAFQRDDYPGAIVFWERMTSQPDIDPETNQMIMGYIAHARELGGIAPYTVEQTPGAAKAGSVIEVTVSLDQGLAAQTKPSDTVFIFAKAANGPSIPLAVIRRSVQELPLTVSLNDSLAMMPEMTLSRFPEVIVSARISSSANAMAQPGDLIGTSLPLSTKQPQQLSLVISEKVE
ncbi:MAG: c-type cytochrome biogenesis protein CcmI [Gammaproteobacteria bacterium]|nr:MAG: c-type cytochrome biogenesis protein CcmI [Gammaproteobacteria bacterium]